MTVVSAGAIPDAIGDDPGPAPLLALVPLAGPALAYGDMQLRTTSIAHFEANAGFGVFCAALQVAGFTLVVVGNAWGEGARPSLAQRPFVRQPRGAMAFVAIPFITPDGASLVVAGSF